MAISHPRNQICPSAGSLKNMEYSLWIKKNRVMKSAQKMSSVIYATQGEASSTFSCTKAKEDCLRGITMGTNGTVTGKEVGLTNTKTWFG